MKSLRRPAFSLLFMCESEWNSVRLKASSLSNQRTLGNISIWVLDNRKQTLQCHEYVSIFKATYIG